MKRFLTIVLFFTLHASLFGQTTTISGKIIDIESGDPIPFVNVVFSGSQIGTVTDFEGYYSISTSQPVDSLTASYIGYKTRTKSIRRGIVQTINFQLEADVISLDEVLFESGENPAWPIMRNVIKNKAMNDKRSLQAYNYESYTKIEIDIDQIPDKMKERKIMTELSQMMDSAQMVAGEDGKPILPLFISESISRFYVNYNPEQRKENIVKSKISGVGIEDGSLATQFIGSSFQEYNFYKNWMTIVEKEFISPLASGWKGYYNYYLVDSTWVDGHFCYVMDVVPKRKEDLAFTGQIWITKNEYALRQIDVSIPKSANLNYIEKIKLQQRLEPTREGAWLPAKTRVLIDVMELTKTSPGLLFKFYNSNQDWVLNDPKPPKFFEYPIELEEDYLEQDEAYWQENRHDTLTSTEQYVYAMIDTMVNIPRVKTYIDIIEILVSGYYEAGKVDIGPYMSALAINDVEGIRFRLGFKTNEKFSKKVVFSGYGAYGTRDEHFKYGATFKYIIKRKPWTTLTLDGYHDVDQVGLERSNLIDNPLFYAATRFGPLRRPYRNTEGSISFQSQYAKGLIQRFKLRHQYFDPLFDFAYRVDPSDPESELRYNYNVTEVQVTTRYAKDETMIINDNERISLGTRKWPIFTLDYTYGIKGLLGGDLEYHKLSLNIQQSLKMGKAGRGWYSVNAGKIFSTIPYPLLKVHIGNESIFFSTASFNLMNWFEFVSDQYVELRYNHHFDGLVLNRIPLMRKLKWRLVGVANLAYGSTTQENQDIIPEFDDEGTPIPRFDTLDRLPYIELGYGIENIFKVARVDFYHRLTYRDNPGVSKFAVKINFQFIL